MENLPEKTEYHTYVQDMDINQKLIFNMRDLNHTMRSLYEGKASQKRILIILHEVKSITQRDLTMRLGIQPGSASEILSKLENAGLILRTISKNDRRTADVSLTERGRQLALEAAAQRSKRHMEMFSCLSESEKEELLELLEKVNEDWSSRYGTLSGKHTKKRCGHRNDEYHQRTGASDYVEIH